MKIGQITQKLKSKIKKRYVKKSDFEELQNEVKRLTKKLEQLEKSCGPVKAEKPASNAVKKAKPKAAEKTAPKVNEKKTESKPVEATSDANLTGPQDDLTRIKGIGPVLEKKLHTLGISLFSQIAGWGETDIEKISAHLNFKGRVEREEWVQQAKNLV